MQGLQVCKFPSEALKTNNLARRAGLEPAVNGFGGQRFANLATGAKFGASPGSRTQKHLFLRQVGMPVPFRDAFMIQVEFRLSEFM